MEERHKSEKYRGASQTEERERQKSKIDRGTKVTEQGE